MLRSSVLIALLLTSAAASAEPIVVVQNLMIGTNRMLQTNTRIAKADVTGDQFCRVKYQENGYAIELFPLRNGKTRIWVYDYEGRVFQEIRVNVCSKEVIALYDQYAAAYRSVEGLVVDVENNTLAFSGTVFSIAAYREITELAGRLGFSVRGLQLHPYVNAVLQESPSAIGSPPTAAASPAPGSP